MTHAGALMAIFYKGALVPWGRLATPGYHAPLKSVDSFLLQTMRPLVALKNISPLSLLTTEDRLGTPARTTGWTLELYDG